MLKSVPEPEVRHKISRMKTLVIAGLLAVPMLSAAQGTRTFTGVITDAECAAVGHSRMQMGPTDAECVLACIDMHGATYVLLDGNDVYALSDQKTPQKFAGQKVTIVGTLDEKTKTIQVESMSAAAEMSAEDMASLRTIVMAKGMDRPITASVVQLFGLAAPPENIPSKQLWFPGADCFVIVSAVPNTDDIIFTINTDVLIQLFLTNSSGTLRAAAIVERTGSRLFTNQQAATGYRTALRTWGDILNATR